MFRGLMAIGASWEARGAPERAEFTYRRGMELDAAAESLYRLLIAVQAKWGRYAKPCRPTSSAARCLHRRLASSRPRKRRHCTGASSQRRDNLRICRPSVGCSAASSPQVPPHSDGDRLLNKSGQSWLSIRQSSMHSWASSSVTWARSCMLRPWLSEISWGSTRVSPRGRRRQSSWANAPGRTPAI